MTTQIGASVFVDQSEITHHVTDGNPVLVFGPYPTVNRVDVHLRDRATIHAVIAHLVALEQEMAPPVPACPSVAPASGRPCTETGEHDCHRAGMITWTDAPQAVNA